MSSHHLYILAQMHYNESSGRCNTTAQVLMFVTYVGKIGVSTIHITNLKVRCTGNRDASLGSLYFDVFHHVEILI